MAVGLKLKRMVPWWAKIFLKIGISRLPIGYSTLRSLGLFRNGDMGQYNYAEGVYRQHTSARVLQKGWVGLELGPGDSVASAIFAFSDGAEHFYLVDSQPYASRALKRYRQLASEMSMKRGTHIHGLEHAMEASSWNEFLHCINAHYLTGGVQSLATLPAQSVDLSWSQAVLEHVRVKDFRVLASELFRITKPGGVSSHVIDFKDHLGGGLNHMRFAADLWEKDWFASQSGFYTNRLRFSQVLSIFEAAGFRCEVKSSVNFSNLPLDRRGLAAELKATTDNDLMVSDAWLLLHRPA